MNDKTEYLFESDEEKEIIKNALLKDEKKKKKKNKLILIIANIAFIVLLIIVTVLTSNYIINTKISKIIASDNNTVPNEKMNKYSNSLKQTYNNENSKYEILINKANPIKEDELSSYTIVRITDNTFDNIKLEEETYKNYSELKKHLLEKNYYINIRSGYRSFLESEEIFNKYKKIKGLEYANKYVAKPGTSEHNTGLAMDIVISKENDSNQNDYASDEYFYLENIAYLYGFIIRYPKDKEKITGYEYEPWHLRYVGKDLAKYLKKNNLSLEEFYNKKEANN